MVLNLLLGIFNFIDEVKGLFQGSCVMSVPLKGSEINLSCNISCFTNLVNFSFFR